MGAPIRVGGIILSAPAHLPSGVSYRPRSLRACIRVSGTAVLPFNL